MKNINSRLVIITLLVLLGFMVARQTLLVSQHIVSDTLFLVGIASLLLGLLVVVRNSRLFDIVDFSFRLFVEVIMNRSKGSTQQVDDYADYRWQPRPRRDPRVFLGLGSICLFFSAFAALLQK